MSISESRVELSPMIDLLAEKYADAPPPESPRNTNRYLRVIGATPPRSEWTDRQEDPHGAIGVASGRSDGRHEHSRDS
jgi:hypothetical protein